MADLDPVFDPEALAALLRGRRLVALTGAGCSTGSGIPDYRGRGTPPRSRLPIQHHEFVRDPAARRRYWARAHLGWPQIAAARPNPAHLALAAFERAGALAGVITQNVDGLHGDAGSRRVIELHGALRRVRCLGCEARTDRAELATRLHAANPDWPVGARAFAPAPDGDADLDDAAVAAFQVVACAICGGALMPDVVFFGGNVAPPTLAAAWALLADAEALLVLGSSLTVFSGYRFVRRAAELGVPVVIVNHGPTRGDPLATRRVDAEVGAVLTDLVARLGAGAV